MGTIVVGIDGSPGSDAALRWALDEARLRGSRLRAVHVYQRGMGYLSWFQDALFSVVWRDDFERRMKAPPSQAKAPGARR